MCTTGKESTASFLSSGEVGGSCDEVGVSCGEVGVAVVRLG